MRYSASIPLVAGILNCLLALFIFSRNWRGTLNRVYLFYGAALGVWNIGVFFILTVPLVDNTIDRAHALFWGRFLQFGVIFLPVALFHLGVLIAKVRTGKVLPLLYGLFGLFALSNLSDFFVKNSKFFIRDIRFVTGTHHQPYGWYAVGGPGFTFWFIATSATCVATLVVFFRQLKHLPPIHRSRVKSLMVGCSLIILFGNNDVMPILGIYNYPWTEIPIYPLGCIAAIIYGIIAAHSVLQHQLLDIHLTLGRMTAHVVRLSFLLLICLMLLLVVESFFPAELTRPGIALVMSVFLISAVAASKMFPRLFGKGADTLERRILGDKFEYHDKIQSFVQSLPWYTDSKSLMDDFHDLLTHTVKVKNYSIVLLDETIRKFAIYRSYPLGSGEQPLNLERDSPIFQHFYATKEDCLVLNSDYRGTERTGLEKLGCQQLAQFDSEFCYCFYSEDDPVGLLLIGKKVSGELYTPHDLSLLRSVVKNLSLIMNQIRLKQRVLVAEEMELLGRMSRGMAHDLNNLITPVWTYVQLALEAAHEEDTAYELLPTVARNVETIQDYIRESLFYSNTLTPHFLPGRLDETVRKSIQLISPQLVEKNVTIISENLPEVKVELDSVLIQRMISNLLGNAGDASPTGSQIAVKLSRLSRTEASRDWYRLEIIDKGTGISAENLQHVFRPYFTTKDRGSGKRGFGLGLAICRKIVLLHGGNLSINSEENKGTTVIVDLPSRRVSNPEKPKAVMSHAHAA